MCIDRNADTTFAHSDMRFLCKYELPCPKSHTPISRLAIISTLVCQLAHCRFALSESDCIFFIKYFFSGELQTEGKDETA